MSSKVTITESQERDFKLHQKKSLNPKRGKQLEYLMEQIERRGYEVEERRYNVGVQVFFQFKGEIRDGKVFAMKENNSSGGFGIFIRVDERLIEFKQSELVLFKDEK